MQDKKFKKIDLKKSSLKGCTVGVYLPGEVKEIIDTLADADRRSTSSYCAMIIEQSIRNKKDV
jgi:predicted DNA-binding protein